MPRDLENEERFDFQDFSDEVVSLIPSPVVSFSSQSLGSKVQAAPQKSAGRILETPKIVLESSESKNEGEVVDEKETLAEGDLKMSEANSSSNVEAEEEGGGGTSVAEGSDPPATNVDNSDNLPPNVPANGGSVVQQQQQQQQQIPGEEDVGGEYRLSDDDDEGEDEEGYGQPPPTKRAKFS
mmetsp:Transcript_41855/g.58442  ORF Transcript_41855/g.58442 Transcript_41855/m.58442 type:complete len:182 (+) Transcript_41855:1362-1907(+)|eukprot:CAMPEP_0201481262 /NCGR_PEP_ID=MMETSP0151_2-20130828/5543_1 /ASSEMBLY_ACC=CAM_ASM_000257 /TAXON_ID=200890 /ORGANISM="Paramoeba atlantica, Strain 621/1 / CCAP 1560/9" /LENGTH=181 /DNA_ID=CAMNT_0047863363 /DNA_START=663 /DNA_END=1208 /DNA_ORIENTATION=+